MSRERQSQSDLVEVESSKAGADDSPEVGAALLLAQTILGAENGTFGPCCVFTQSIFSLKNYTLNPKPARVLSVWDASSYNQRVSRATRIPAKANKSHTGKLMM